MVGGVDHRPLFRRALGEDWDLMPETWRRLHSFDDTRVLTGEARIRRGDGLLSRAIARAFRFPASGENVPVRVTMDVRGAGERWTRHFGDRRFRSDLTEAEPGRIYERFGPFRFLLALPVSDGRMGMPVERGWLLGVPLPKWLLPRSETREFIEDGVFQFDVRLSAPLAGFIVHYRGWLK